MADWQDLQKELDAWADGPAPATFWWRDDDAIETTDALIRMLGIARRHGAALGLAVIPGKARKELHDVLRDFKTVSVLQHGISHIDHSVPGQKRIELGPQRDQEVLLKELATGFSKICEFDTCLPILVPPWNRIDRTIMAHLPAIGFKGISTYTKRTSVFAAPGLINLHTHVDIIDWPGSRRFIGTDQALDVLIGHLKERRCGDADADEPTGLLTHHLDHDEDCWTFIEEFLAALENHSSASLINISEALRP